MMQVVKGSLKSKTVWFGYALIVLPFFQSEWKTWEGLVPEALRPYLLSLVGLAVVVLRYYTTTSLAEKANVGAS